MASFTQRMVGAARLDVSIYEEVEGDPSALGQAMGVVVLAALASGIGGAGEAGLRGPIAGAVAALVGWFLWAAIAWFVGTKILPEPQTSADIGQLLRTTGFSASPGVLRALGFIPFLGALVRFVAEIWMLVAMVIAVRQALDYQSTGRAVLVCVIGFLFNLAVAAVAVLVFGLDLGALGR